MRDGLLSSALLFLAAAACSPEVVSVPVIREVSPAQIAQGTEATVELLGENLKPVVITDFKRSQRSRVESTFTAALERPAAAPLPLQDVRFVSSSVLSARVPATAEQALYDVRVRLPDGEEVLLAAGFRVVAPSSAVTRFRISPIAAQRIGIPFQVEIAALDDEGRLVEGYDGALQLSEATGTATPVTTGPLSLGRITAYVTVSTLATGLRLVVRDVQGRTGESDPFNVVAGLPVQLALGVASTATAGECLRVEVRVVDQDGRPTPAPSAFTARVSTGSSGGAFFSNSTCATASADVAFASGASTAELWFRPTSAGSATVMASSPAYPSTQTAIAVQPANAAALAFESPARAVARNSCSAVLQLRVVDAFGNVTAGAVTANLVADSGSGVSFFTDTGCVTAATSVQASASAAGFYVRGPTAGVWSLTATPVGQSLSAATQPLEVTP